MNGQDIQIALEEDPTMGNVYIDTGRIRAWLLIKAREPESAARHIYTSWGDKGENDYVVIRADVVDSDFNIVVPVDALSDDMLREVVKLITDVEGVQTITIARVLNHNPVPTYLAHGFVSVKEEKYAEKEKKPKPDKTGRIKKNSPGDNPWG
jgi:hypothetical protein